MQARLLESQDCFSLEKKPMTWRDSLAEEGREASLRCEEGHAGGSSPSAAVT